MNALSGKRVLVVGLGRSGIAAAELCAARGARVTVTDKRPAAELAGATAKLPAGVAPELGGHRRESFLSADLIVLSPGVPEIAELAAARAAGVEITGELELASRFVSATIVAITGTNGKSTTTTLVGEMLRATGRPTFVGGNLGEPLAEAVGTPAAEAGGFCVVEVSSFQLETVETFHPRVAVLLNITADHLDRYDGMDGYAAAKARLFAAQTSTDFAVVNFDDPLAVRASETGHGRREGFSIVETLATGAWLGGPLLLRLPGADPESYPADLPWLIGQRHNQANALAALLAARLAGASPAEARAGLLAFRPLAHRMELVAEAGGIAYYDDSKGTNVGAVVAALDGFPRPVVLIAGGRDKGGDYAPLAAVLGRVGRAAILIGEAADKMQAAFHGVLPVERAPTLEAAVDAARRRARPGDAVVLSPACSSFDMFRDYAHRAEAFRAAVARATKPEGAP
ncbi:MAG TPA: UDP-N-acetylmuramoyl-L-alanine--D-glutamate ligase [Polyangia bacterium]|nr:UDP-N-acetylmuramoyl-L-alanine--D-glutamate ligase [Polyangia bacterium]